MNANELTPRTPRARLQATLCGAPVDRLPVAPLYLHLYLARQVRRHALLGYRRWMGDRKEVALEPEAELAIQGQAIISAWKSLSVTPDWIWTQQLPATDWLAECVLIRDGRRLWRVHQPSGVREELSGPRTSGDETDLWKTPIPDTRQAIEARIPVTSADDLLSSGAMDLVRYLLDAVGDEIFVYGKMGTPFWKCYLPLGFHGLMTLPLQRPELMHRIVERSTESLKALAEAYCRVGVHGVFLEQCLTSADLISPEIYETFVLPYDRTILNTFKQASIPTVLYVCGDIVPRLPYLADLGPAALAVEEPKKGFQNDLAEVAVGIGDQAALFGNLDATRIADWDRSQLLRQLKTQVRASRSARGFVVSMGSPFPLDTPVEKVAAFTEAARSPELARIAKGMDNGDSTR